jgi:hypothetical protein
MNVARIASPWRGFVRWNPWASTEPLSFSEPFNGGPGRLQTSSQNVTRGLLPR